MARRGAGVALVIALVLLGVVGTRPAMAQTMSADHCTNAGSGGSGLNGGGTVGGGSGGGGGGSWGGGATATTTTTTPNSDGEDGVCSSLLDSIAPGPNPGPNPTGNYDIGYDEGGSCLCTNRRVVGLVTAALFSWSGWVVRLGLGIINWVLNFGLVRALMPAAQRVSDSYQRQVVNRTGLAGLFLFLCALWGGYMAFTGRIGRGATELGISLTILAAAGTFWSNPGASLQRGLDFTAGVSSEIGAVGTGAPVDTRSQGVGTSMARAIHKAFVEDTHQIINWGRKIPPGDQCRAVYDQAVATGPWGTSSKPRLAMKAVGCKKEDAFNRTPSMDRMGSALLVFLASILLITMLVMVTYELVKAQLEILLALVVWPFALLFGALPGKGRSFFWHFVGSTGMALGKVMAMMLLLAMTLTGTSAVLSFTAGEKLFPQMSLVIVVVSVGLAKRKGILDGSKRAVQEFTATMSGGTHRHSGKGWLSPAAAFTGGAIASRAQHAFQTHGSNSRSRSLLAVTQGQAATADQTAHRTAVNTGTSASYLEGVYSILNGAANGEYRDQPPPTPEPERVRPDRVLDPV